MRRAQERESISRWVDGRIFAGMSGLMCGADDRVVDLECRAEAGGDAWVG